MYQTLAHILQIGTGLGLWPISQALEWPDATFIGLDIAPCQTDLNLLAEAEKRSRSSKSGVPSDTGMWESIAQRITWDRGDL